MIAMVERLVAGAKAKLIKGVALAVAGVFVLLAAWFAAYGGFEKLVSPPFAAALTDLSFAIVIAVCGIIVGGIAASRVPAPTVRSSPLTPAVGMEIGAAVIRLLGNFAAAKQRARHTKARRKR
ncbi:MAG: hypothetical protein ACYDD1_05215 [Caulobacteraceae bacterium]